MNRLPWRSCSVQPRARDQLGAAGLGGIKLGDEEIGLGRGAGVSLKFVLRREIGGAGEANDINGAGEIDRLHHRGVPLRGAFPEQRDRATGHAQHALNRVKELVCKDGSWHRCIRGVEDGRSRNECPASGSDGLRAGCQADDGRVDETRRAGTVEHEIEPAIAAVPDPELIEVEAAERARFSAQVRRDTAALRLLLGDELRYTHSNALIESKEHFIETVATGSIVYDQITAIDMVHRVYANTAVGHGKVRVGVTMGGQTLEVDLLFTTVLIKRGGRWQLVAWQSTRVP